MTDHGTGMTRIVSVCSGKGGVGKSILAFNLAERLAARGLRVLLVDADSSCGNLHILTNTGAGHGFREFVGGELSLADAATSTRFGFDLLAAGGEELSRIDRDASSVAEAMAALRRQSSPYDIVIMDHGPGISKAAEIMAHASDTVLLVLVPELTSISDAYGLFKLLNQGDPGLDCRILVNRVESAEEAAYIHDRFGEITGRFLDASPPCLGYLLEARQVRQSVAGQTALAQIAPESQVSQILTKLAGKLAEICGWSETAESTTPIESENEINKTTALADIRE